jgi:alpha-L-arabinofuranosidase
LVLTLINPKDDVAMKVDCGIGGAASAKARLLYHPDFNACNTFENPNLVVPKEHPVSVQGGRLQMDLPPISMASVIVALA